MKRRVYRWSISVVACFVCVAVSAGQVNRPPVKVGPAKAPPLAPSNPQGGLIVENPQAHVLTPEDLYKALQAAANAAHRCESPYVIWIENTADIDLDYFDDPTSTVNYILQVPSCVTLASGRSATQDGGLLHLKRRLFPQLAALSLGNRARVTGLRLQGPYAGSDSGGNPNMGILITGVGQATVDNNEIYDWPQAGVNVSGATNTQETAAQIEIRGNFIHDTSMDSLGYGVVVGGAGYANIERNLFDFNRHAVADDGCVPNGGPKCVGYTGYIATLNFVLSGGDTYGGHYTQHFDVHGLGPGCGSAEPDHCGGLAGQYFDIRYNAIRGAQSYGFNKRLTRPALELRGTPAGRAYFRDNAVSHDNQGDAIRTPANDPQSRLYISNIQYKTNTGGQLAVGDFDGDGCDDVFQATGAVWVYSPCGRREWRFLNQSSKKLSGLAFGDFDGDGKTDVFRQDGATWLVSYGGTGMWTPLPAGSNIPMSTYGFADFDGDGKTDVFRANGTEWFYSSGGATMWKHLNYSKLGIKDIRFGHFNPKNPKETDIFAIVNGEWSVSYGGTSKWRKLNDKISDSLNGLVFGDFNGDGITDIAYGAGSPPPQSNAPLNPTPITWYVSWGGASPWQVLNSWTAPANEYVPALSDMLIGRFGGAKHDDVITQLESGIDSRVYFFWSSSGMAPFAQRSVYTTE
jgi:hypothetical protein